MIQLTPEQQAVVSHSGGHATVVGVPGCGKTETLVRRIEHMVKEQGIAPGRILVLMFNREARFQCRERLAELLPQGRRPAVHTFHSFAASVEWFSTSKLQFAERMLWSEGAVQHHVRVAATTLARDEVLDWPAVESLDVEQTIQAIGLWKSKLIPPERAGHLWDDWRMPFVYERFEQIRREAGAKTYDDFVPRALDLLMNPQIKRAYTKYRHIIVDEAQDINWAQWVLLLKLVRDGDASLMLIGDDDQCIYAWRGASARYLQSGIQTDLGPCTEYQLTHSFRMGPVLAQAAQNVIDHNRERAGSHLVAHNDAQWGEVELIKGRIDALGTYLLTLVREKKVHPRAIMILGRTHAQLTSLSAYFTKVKVPHIQVGREQFHRQPECQRLLDYLRLAMRLEEDVTEYTQELIQRIINVPNRFINRNQLRSKLRSLGGQVASTLLALSRDRAYNESQQARIARLLDILIDLHDRLDEGADGTLRWLVVMTRYQKHWVDYYGPGVEAQARIEGYETLIDYARTTGLLAREFVTHCDGLDTRLGQDEEQLLVLTTSFRAKGLEAPVVVIPNAQEGFMPVLRENDIGDPTYDRTRVEREPWECDARLADERRLFYVTITRAVKSLVIHSDPGPNRPTSRFVAEMELEETQPLFAALQRVKAGVGEPGQLMDEVKTVHRRPILDGLCRYIDGDLLAQVRSAAPREVLGFEYPQETQPAGDDGQFELSQAWWEVKL